MGNCQPKKAEVHGSPLEAPLEQLQVVVAHGSPVSSDDAATNVTYIALKNLNAENVSQIILKHSYRFFGLLYYGTPFFCICTILCSISWPSSLPSPSSSHAHACIVRLINVLLFIFDDIKLPPLRKGLLGGDDMRQSYIQGVDSREYSPTMTEGTFSVNASPVNGDRCSPANTEQSAETSVLIFFFGCVITSVIIFLPPPKMFLFPKLQNCREHEDSSEGCSCVVFERESFHYIRRCVFSACSLLC